jgi:hypothetical protein
MLPRAVWNKCIYIAIFKEPPNKALHRTAIPLRSIAAGELGR